MVSDSSCPRVEKAQFPCRIELACRDMLVALHNVHDPSKYSFVPRSCMVNACFLITWLQIRFSSDTPETRSIHIRYGICPQHVPRDHFFSRHRCDAHWLNTNENDEGIAWKEALNKNSRWRQVCIRRQARISFWLRLTQKEVCAEAPPAGMQRFRQQRPRPCDSHTSGVEHVLQAALVSSAHLYPSSRIDLGAIENRKGTLHAILAIHVLTNRLVTRAAVVSTHNVQHTPPTCRNTDS
jgi:hypothetical protein